MVMVMRRDVISTDLDIPWGLALEHRDLDDLNSRRPFRSIDMKRHGMFAQRQHRFQQAAAAKFAIAVRRP